MATAGPNYASAAVSDSTLAGNAWSNPGNAGASDSSYATASSNGTQYLKATGFGFSIPTGAVIDGIVVEWERKASGSTVKDKAVRIVKGGTVGATDKSVTTDWPTTDAFASYGSAADLWGETWTAADINAASFGAAIATQSIFVRTASVDAVRITVYYTPQIDLTSDAAAVATAAADLTTAIALSGDLAGTATAVGDLTTGIALQGAATAAASASAYFSVVLDGTMQAQASASADLTTGIALAGNAAGIATLAGDLTTQIPLAGDSASVATAAAGLSTQIAPAGAMSSVASASASLTTSIRLAGSLAAGAAASADLSVGRVFIPPASQRIYLAEITCYDPALPGIRTLRYSSGADGYDNGGILYEPLIQQPATLRREIPTDVVGGHVSASYGALTLVNASGQLKALRDYYFGGYELTLKVGEAGAPYASFTTRLKATVETASFEPNRMAIRLRGREETLKTPLQTLSYGGTNVLPDGLDGTPDDQKGKQRPLGFGRLAAITPPCVNTSLQIYEISTSAFDDIVNVFDGGTFLTRGTEYTSLSAFKSSTVGAGGYNIYKAGPTYIKLEREPFRTLAVCAAEKWDYTQISAAGILKRILQSLGYTAADWVEQDFLDLDAANAGSLGILVGDGETIDSVLDRICISVGAWWGFDNLNRFRVRRFDGPAGNPVATITDEHIQDFGPVGPVQRPLWEVTVQGDWNYAVQPNANLTGQAQEQPARAQWWDKASRDQVISVPSVKANRPLAEKTTLTSYQNGISQCLAEGTRRRARFDDCHDPIAVTLGAPDAWMDLIDLGSEVVLVSDQCGYPAGRAKVVVMTQPDFQRNRLDLILWG